MTLLLALVLDTGTEADAVIKRFSDLLAATDTMSVQMEVSRFKYGSGKAVFAFEKPNKLYFDVTLNGTHYTFATDGKRTIELNHTARVFDELPADVANVPYDSLLAKIAHFTFPRMFVTGLKPLLAEGFSFKYAGQTTFAGQPADQLTCDVPSPFGKVHYRLTVGKDGKLLVSNIWGDTHYYGFEAKLVFHDYKLNPSLPANLFQPKPVMGYVPYTLPFPEPMPAAINDALTVGTWTDVSRSSDVDLDQATKGKQALFVFVAPNSEPSSTLLRNLGLWQQEMKGKGEIYVLSLAASAKEAAGASYYRKDSASSFARAGVPLIVLRSPTGSVTRVWSGFNGNPGELKRYREELREALTSKAR